MAVKHVETFSFEVPLAAVEPDGESADGIVTVTMGRAELDQLWDDIGVALGYGRRGASKAPYAYELADEEPLILTDEQAATDPEQIAARLQVEAEVRARQTRASRPDTIGSGQMH